MKQPEEVVGTLVALRPVTPETPGTRTQSADLRVDAVKTAGSALQPGQVLAVTAPLATDQHALGLGDQVQVTLTAVAGGWEAAQPVVVLGRGEFLNPGAEPTTDIGSKDAKILVKMFAPFPADCQKKTRDLILQFARAHPEQVRAQIFDLAQKPGREEARKERLACATVLVNNRDTFSLPLPAGEQTVTFQNRPNQPGSPYTSEEVVTVLEREVERQYGGTNGLSPVGHGGPQE